MAHNLFNVNMIGMMIEEKLGDMIKLYPLALVKQMDAKAGATIDIPVTKYIGDATEVEAGEVIPQSDLTQEIMNAHVKKMAKRLTFTQEDINNAYIDVNQEAEKQLLKSIANGVEKDMFAELENSTQKAEVTKLDTDGLADAVVPFGEDLEENMYLFISPSQLAELRKDPDFIVNANHGGKIVGSAGMIFGMEVIVTNRVVGNKAFIVKEGALALFLKKAVEVEVDKDITKQVYDIVATQHYVVKLVDVTKAIAVTIA